MTHAEFVAKSFATRTAAHTLHLLSDSYAQHIALGEFYDALLDKTDEYAEVAMGIHGQFESIPFLRAPTDSPVALLEAYERLVNDQLDATDTTRDLSLNNILCELQGLTARTLYKLKNLK